MVYKLSAVGEMYLLSIRGPDSIQTVPDLKLAGMENSQVLRQAEEVLFNAECCVALLAGLRPLEDFSVPKEHGAFAVLRRQYRGFYHSIQAYVRYIFIPTADHLNGMDEMDRFLEEKASDVSKSLKSCITTLRQGLEAPNDKGGQRGEVELPDTGEMLARSPWVCSPTLRPRTKIIAASQTIAQAAYTLA
ncbi:MAG: hypothetical protein Q9170_001513 [Blastenia crenularia]